MRGPHESDFAEEAIANFTAEAKGKVASKQTRLVLYDEIKRNFPEQMKVSPIEEIPHKSKAYISMLDLSLSIKITPHGSIPSVNKNSENQAQ